MDGNTVTTKELNITCGIFQGDALSSLIFCIALFSLLQKLHHANTGFHIGKVYAKDNEEMERYMTLVCQFSDDIGMMFGLSKCAILSVHK
eukprot:863176-Ditylum_brightwellii.AAC.1